jgi:hypothetical protein
MNLAEPMQDASLPPRIATWIALAASLLAGVAMTAVLVRQGETGVLPYVAVWVIALFFSMPVKRAFLPGPVGVIAIVLTLAAVIVAVWWTASLLSDPRGTHLSYYPPIWACVVGVTLACLLIAQAFLPSQEERLSDELAESSDTLHAVATVMSLSRGGVVETSGEQRTLLTLVLQWQDRHCKQHVTRLRTRVENPLLPSFATGQTVHLLVDPDDTRRIAIDREHSPTEVR